MNDQIKSDAPQQKRKPEFDPVKSLASLETPQIIHILSSLAAERGISITSPNPTLRDILHSARTTLAAHRRRRIIDFPGGEDEWRKTENRLDRFVDVAQQVIEHHSAAHPEQFQPVKPDRSGERASERPPNDPRAEADQSPNASASALASNDASNADTTTASDGSANTSTSSASPPSSSLQEASRETREAYLARLLRERTSRSPLDDLPPDRQQLLYELATEFTATVLSEMLAQPPPLGWGLKIHESSIKRFRDRYRKIYRETELATAAKEIETLVKNPAAHAHDFTEATHRLLQLRLYHKASEPFTNVNDLKFLSHIIDRQRRTNVAERRVQLAEQKLAK